MVERAWQSPDEIKYAALSPPPKGVVGGCRLATNKNEAWRIQCKCIVVYSLLCVNVSTKCVYLHCRLTLFFSAAPTHDVIDILSSDDEDCAPPPPKKLVILLTEPQNIFINLLSYRTSLLYFWDSKKSLKK